MKQYFTLNIVWSCLNIIQKFIRNIIEKLYLSDV